MNKITDTNIAFVYRGYAIAHKNGRYFLRLDYAKFAGPFPTLAEVHRKIDSMNETFSKHYGRSAQ